jgi:hypothetical protein
MVLLPLLAGACTKGEAGNTTATAASSATVASAAPVASAASPAATASLTNERAKAALETWAKSRAREGGRGAFAAPEAVTVVGVSEKPAENAAEADVEVKAFPWEGQVDWRVYKFTGPAKARFTRYNDGRWVLSSVTIQRRTGGILDPITERTTTPVP